MDTINTLGSGLSASSGAASGAVYVSDDTDGQVPGVGARRRRGGAAKLGLVAVIVVALICAVVGGALFVNRLTQQRQAQQQAAKVDRAKATAQTTEATVRDFAAEKNRMEREDGDLRQLQATSTGALPVPAGAQPVPLLASGRDGTGRGQGNAYPASPVVGTGAQAMPSNARGGWYSGVVLATAGASTSPLADSVSGTMGALGPLTRQSTLQGTGRAAGQVPQAAVSGPLQAAAELDEIKAQALQLMQGMQGPLATAEGQAGVQPSAEAAQGLGEVDRLDSRLRPSRTGHAATVRATVLPDLTFLLQQGTMVPCISSRIVTTYPGMVTCTLMQDVYSADGRTLLLRKGAKAIGEQKSALLQGQARVFALWTSIDDGQVTLQLDSPATDPLGGSGIDAWTDTHFWSRFGGAMMVSFLGDLGQAMTQPTGQQVGTTVVLSGASNTARTLAEETLKNTINIAPTGYVDQGAIVYIFVARHVDFGGVYELRRR